MKRLLAAFLGLFKGLFRFLTALRILFFNVLFLALIGLVAVAILVDSEPGIDDDSILTLSLVGDIVEESQPEDTFDEFFSPRFWFTEKPRETLLQDVIDAISAAREDPRIRIMLLDLDELGAIGLNQLNRIGSALSYFRDSGKTIIAAEDYYSQSQYYLASHADKIFLNPMGTIYLNGYGLYRYYFKDALDKLKVNFHVFQVGSYKSALEPVTRNSMSPQDRSQTREWLSSLWDSYCADVAGQRSLSPTDVNEYINRVPANLRDVGGDMAVLAREYGLVDELKHRHEIHEYLADLVGRHPDDGLPLVDFHTYLSAIERSYRAHDSTQDSVGLITAQGVITNGRSGPGTIGAATLTSLIRKAREADHVKALVLRVDSGGGSAFGSELIRQELLELKKAGKPLIVSMGSFAASGGYWISADADEIWASPNSLTGSIGIFMALPTFENVLNNFGVYRDGVGTTNLSAGLDSGRPLPDEMKEAIQLMLEHGYRSFISLVAEGRNLSVEEVERLAQGRVYSGAAAEEIGLVDRLGTLPEALRSAADLAGLDDYVVSTLAAPPSFTDRLLQQIGIESGSVFSTKGAFFSTIRELFSFDKNLQSLVVFDDPNHIYSHCMIDYTR